MTFRRPSRIRHRSVTGPPQHGQRGIYVVEFAIVAAVFLFMVLGAIEVSRLMFTWSALDAATQRGARVAAVCPIGDGAVPAIALFGDGTDEASPVLPELVPGNVSVTYLNGAGGATANYAAARYVRVSITGYQHRMLLPPLIAGFAAPLLTAPPFTTTRPVESLGNVPADGAANRVAC